MQSPIIIPFRLYGDSLARFVFVKSICWVQAAIMSIVFPVVDPKIFTEGPPQLPRDLQGLGSSASWSTRPASVSHLYQGLLSHSEHRFPAPSSKLCQNWLRH